MELSNPCLGFCLRIVGTGLWSVLGNLCIFKRGKPPAAWLATQEIFMTLKSVRPKKFLGQHFLKDQNVAKAIADTVDACPDIPVLEVGPGMGVLTQYLLPKSARRKWWRLISRA